MTSSIALLSQLFFVCFLLPQGWCIPYEQQTPNFPTCTSNSDCNVFYPHCNTAIKECRSTPSCPGGTCSSSSDTPTCFFGTCVQCVRDQDCNGFFPKCNKHTAICGANEICNVDSDCKQSGQRCWFGRCGQCVSNSQCSGGQRCNIQVFKCTSNTLCGSGRGKKYANTPCSSGYNCFYGECVAQPTKRPTKRPTAAQPTPRPTSSQATPRPTKRPTYSQATPRPTKRPTTPVSQPTNRPTMRPTMRPTQSSRPTFNPSTSRPTYSPAVVSQYCGSMGSTTLQSCPPSTTKPKPSWYAHALDTFIESYKTFELWDNGYCSKSKNNKNSYHADLDVKVKFRPGKARDCSQFSANDVNSDFFSYVNGKFGQISSKSSCYTQRCSSTRNRRRRLAVSNDTVTISISLFSNSSTELLQVYENLTASIKVNTWLRNSSGTPEAKQAFDSETVSLQVNARCYNDCDSQQVLLQRAANKSNLLFGFSRPLTTEGAQSTTAIGARTPAGSSALVGIISALVGVCCVCALVGCCCFCLYKCCCASESSEVATVQILEYR